MKKEDVDQVLAIEQASFIIPGRNLSFQVSISPSSLLVALAGDRRLRRVAGSSYTGRLRRDAYSESCRRSRYRGTGSEALVLTAVKRAYKRGKGFLESDRLTHCSKLYSVLGLQ
jgi:hypothetical protein